MPAEHLEPFEHGRSILRGALPHELRARLFAERETRPKPGLDDKAIASWNGLALAALAEAGRRLERDEWLDAARSLGEFLLGPLSTPAGRLYRTHRNGVSKNTGFLEDYAEWQTVCNELHVATGELRWLEESRRLALLAVELFGDDARGGFFETPSDGEQLIARKKSFDDSSDAVRQLDARVRPPAARRIYGDGESERRAVGVYRLVVNGLRRAPGSFGWALCGLELHFSPPREARDHRDADRRGRPRRAGALAAERRRGVRPRLRHPLLAGKEASRREADGLRLRELRVQGAGDGPRAALGSHVVPLLELEDVTRRFGGILALDRVSLDIEPGEIVGLIGPNGAGKTTAFNVITRLYTPDSGDVRFDGESLLRTAPHRVIHRGIARTFQNVELFPTMTVRENVLLGARASR